MTDCTGIPPNHPKGECPWCDQVGADLGIVNQHRVKDGLAPLADDDPNLQEALYGPLPTTTAWECCPKCRGAGLQDGMYGPVSCYDCKGAGYVRIRDEHGRFATRPIESCAA